MPEYLSAGDLRLAYQRAGAGQPAMLFVHGWSCNRSYFAPQFEYFAAGHAVATMDLPGHGESGQPDAMAGGYEMAALADDVLAVARAAGLHRPVLVGHSLGALIGLVCAGQPGAISGLAMIDPAPITNEAAKTFFRESVAAVRADDDGSWRTAFVKSMFLPTDVAARAAIMQDVRGVQPRVAAELMRVMGEFDGASALAAATVPVLSIGSAHPANSSADLRRCSPEIIIGQTVGAGHFAHLEVPEQVNVMIGKFLAISGC